MNGSRGWVASGVVWCIGILLVSVLPGAPAHAACAFGAGTAGEPSLQSVFDTILPVGTIDAVGDCLDDSLDSVWSASDGVATIVIEIAGFSNQNAFGIYDATDATNRVTVFSGPAGPGATSMLSLAPLAGVWSVMVNGAELGTFVTQNFGFFLATPQNNIFYSDTSLNADGADHMYAYRGQSGSPAFEPGSVLGGRTFGPQFFLLAFEDLAAPGWDADFQDFVVGVEFMAPVPLPGSALLLLSALGGALGMRRRAVRARVSRVGAFAAGA